VDSFALFLIFLIQLDSDGKEKILSVEVDAPGSTENIKTAIRSVLVRGEEGLEKFSLELDAPSKKASISGMTGLKS